MSLTNMTEGERKARYQLVRANFIAKGTTLTNWCQQNGTYIQNIRAAYFGEWSGPKAKELISRVEQPAGI